jgi:hypothetical protein
MTIYEFGLLSASLGRCAKSDLAKYSIHSSIADVSYFENIVSNTWEQQGFKGEKA